MPDRIDVGARVTVLSKREATIGAILDRRALPGLREVSGDAGIVVSSVTMDSARVEPRSVFCCVRGARHNGHDFAAGALAAGATVLLVDHLLDLDITQVVVDDVREAMAPLAAAVNGDPSRRMDVVAVTGTNGKTTTAHLLGEIFRCAGRPTSVLGTLSGRFTTPEAPDLQRELADLADCGVSTVAMEVSSHALVQHRVDGVHFAASVFTNLGRDHLDLHGTLEAYFLAKARLFESDLSDLGVINADDEAGRRLLEGAHIPMVAYSEQEVSDIESAADHVAFVWCGRRVRVPIGGRFNVSNALAAATTAQQLGVPLDEIVTGLAGAQPVPGRFERIGAGQPFHVIVDFAHTPDGLRAVLEAARDAAGSHRVIAVFGCGGDRDRQKRPLMGEVAARLADLVMVTSDNPRSEDPIAIIADILSGVPASDRSGVRSEPDRAVAMEAAFRIAHPGDVVVVAGKGHETTQTIGDQVIEFDDRVVARKILGRLR